MRLKETTKKSTPTTLPLSGELLKTLRISPPTVALHQQQQYMRCSSVGSTSSSGTCETERSTQSTSSATLSPQLGVLPMLLPVQQHQQQHQQLQQQHQQHQQQQQQEAAAAAALAANIAESFTFLQQHAAHHFRDILYAAHMLGRGKNSDRGSKGGTQRA